MTSPLAIGCTRISTQGQKDGYGQTEQAAEITRYADQQGFRLLEIVPEIESGAKELEDRATLQRYYQLAQQHPGVTFIFPRVDRIGRRAELILGIVRELHSRGANVHAIGLPMDLRTKEGTLMLTMLSGMAEYDHRNIRTNMQAGQRRKAQAGLWPHGSPPWGYQLERDHKGRALRPVPVPEQAAAVRRLFELATDHGESTLVQTMRAEGWPAPTSLGWVRKTVNNLLTNELYAGRRVYQGITLEFEPIVPPELLAQVQAARAHRRTQGGGPKTAQPLLLTGHVRCVCGGAMGRDVDKSQYHGKVYSSYTLYRCWKRKRAHLDAPAPAVEHAPPKRAEALEAECWPALVEALTTPERLAEVITPTATGPTEPPPARVAELEAAIARAYEPLTAGAAGYTLSIAETLARPYAEELERLRQAYQAQAAPTPINVRERAAQFRVALQGALDFEQKRALLDELNVQFVVGPRGLERLSLDLP
ncbi:recombinase family protein [Deinococcus navajonensis]|uniref:Recombinase family protein n=1 Tax=Deinococcus navajonensis TaxID=309884 RepID=A0ABV8XGD6_9DEIO